MEILKEVLSNKKWEYKEELYKPVFETITMCPPKKEIGLSLFQEEEASVIIVFHEYSPKLLTTLRALNRQKKNTAFEIILVNNGYSAPFPIREIFQLTDKYIYLNKNTGAYLSRNIGALFATTPILIFLDSDGIPAPDWMESFLLTFKQYKTISIRGKVKTKSVREKTPNHYDLGNIPFPIFANVEGNTLYSAEEFFEVGGWDDSIFFGGGGLELSIRLTKKYKDRRLQIYSPIPVIYHAFKKGTRKAQREKKEKQKYARARLTEKHQYWRDYTERWDFFKGKTFFLIQREGDKK